MLLGIVLLLVFSSFNTVHPLEGSEDVQLTARLTVGELTTKTTDECLKSGGLCVAKSSCPTDNLSEKSGLCGNDGLNECCHSLPKEIQDCHERGGACRPSKECHRGPRDPMGVCNDKDHVCCIFVN